jgi:hypothetical protein
MSALANHSKIVTETISEQSDDYSKSEVLLKTA